MPDLPSLAGKGYQVRALAFVRYLRQHHDVLLVAVRDGPAADVRLRGRTRWRSLAALPTILRRGWPLQCALYDGWDVSRAAINAVRMWRADAAVTVTERLPLTSLALAAELPTVVDVIDAQSANMEMRAGRLRGSAPFWRHEARAFVRLARDLSHSSASTVVCADRERVFYPRAHVIGNGSVMAVTSGPPKDFDVCFTGNLNYWANVEAVEELCAQVVPRLRCKIPGLRVLVAGRNPSEAVKALCRSAGAVLLADVPDLQVVIARSRLAVAPVVSATGTQLKVFEAISAGVRILVYPAVAAGLSEPIAGVEVCGDATEMADRAATLLQRHDPPPTSLPASLTWDARSETFEALITSLVADRARTPWQRRRTDRTIGQ